MCIRDRERTDAAREALQLSHLKDRAVDALSSGEKQRAAIASVYAMKPKVFVCDEPTANLDAAGTKQLAQTLRQLKEQGFTLLIAEHRIDWLMGIADRFLYLRDGRIAAEYTPDVYKRQIVGFNLTLIALGVAGVLPPTTSALLHNGSTLGIGLKNMTDLLDENKS